MMLLTLTVLRAIVEHDIDTRTIVLGGIYTVARRLKLRLLLAERVLVVFVVVLNLGGTAS